MKITPPGKFIDIGGSKLHVQIEGHGDPVVALEAGIAASSLSWCLVRPLLTRFTTVLSYDRAGFGWSDPPRHPCTAADAADDLASLLERSGLNGPFVLAGHSFGCLIARIFQQKYPQRVAGMVLADPVVRSEWRDMPDARRRMLTRGVLLSRRGAWLARAGVVRFALAMLMGGSRRLPKLLARLSAGRGAAVTERLTAEIRKMPAELWPMVAAHWSRSRSFITMAKYLENLPASVNQLDENRGLGDLPVTVLSAADASPRSLGEHKHDSALSTRGEHKIVPGSGHWMPFDAPEEVASAIERVIELVREGA